MTNYVITDYNLNPGKILHFTLSIEIIYAIVVELVQAKAVVQSSDNWVASVD